MKKKLIAITGAGGYLGLTLCSEIERVHQVRFSDIADPQTPGDSVIGDISDPGIADRVVAGVDGLVINHMLSRAPGAYSHPRQPLDVNTTATATLLDAAVRHGCKKIVLISSTEVVAGALRAGEFLNDSLPASTISLYGLSKALQEEVAKYYHRTAGLSVAILRPAYVTDADTMADKYGRIKPSVNWQFIDRRDIASAALAALALDDIGCEVFYVLGHPDGRRRADVQRAMQRLNWAPTHTFGQYPNDP